MFIWLFINIPVPGIVTPEPKDSPRVYVFDTAFPSLSIIEKWVVSLLSFGFLKAFTSSTGLALFESIELISSLILLDDNKSEIGTSKYSGSPTKWDLLLWPLLSDSAKKWYVLVESLLYLLISILLRILKDVNKVIPPPYGGAAVKTLWPL